MGKVDGEVESYVGGEDWSDLSDPSDVVEDGQERPDWPNLTEDVGGETGLTVITRGEPSNIDSIHSVTVVVVVEFP